MVDRERDGRTHDTFALESGARDSIVHRYARILTSPLRYVIVLLWGVAAVAAYQYHPMVAVTSGAQALLAPADAVPLHVELQSLRLFAFPVLSRTVVVQRNPEGLSLAAQLRVVKRAVAINHHRYRDLPGVVGVLPVLNTGAILPSSRERGTTALTYMFFRPDLSLRDRDRLAGTLERDHIKKPGDALVGATGVAPSWARQGDLMNNALPQIELATVALIALIVAITFRSLVAPLLTLFAAGIAYIVAERLIAYLAARQNGTIPDELRPLLVVLILAVSTDYVIFLLSALRNSEGHLPSREATILATRTVAPVILVAGLTISACSLSLMLAHLGMAQALGPALAVAVLVSLAVSLTLVPALLAILGRFSLWPGRSISLPHPWRRSTISWRVRLRRRISSRRAAVAVVVISILVLLAAGNGVLQLRLGLNLLSDLPSSLPESQAFQAARQGFAAGIVSPTLLVVQGKHLVRHRPAMIRLERAISRQPGVAGVIGPREQPIAWPRGISWSRSGDAARMIVIWDSSPYGAPAVNHLFALQHAMPRLLNVARLPRVTVGYAGDTALSQVIISRLDASTLPVGAACGAVVLLLLALLLRSLVVPWFLAAASALAVLAPIGLATYFFQDALGLPDLGYYLPIAAGVLLIALGSDYTLFMVGRIWSRVDDSLLRRAVVVEGARASSAIGTAAVTLAGSFALLALVPLTTVREFAFVMAIGVLIDAFLVRSYLVPALITAGGRIVLWPYRSR